MMDPSTAAASILASPARGHLERQIRRWNGQQEKPNAQKVWAVDELGGRLARLLPEKPAGVDRAR
jgi:hypothetical protein